MARSLTFPNLLNGGGEFKSKNRAQPGHVIMKGLPPTTFQRQQMFFFKKRDFVTKLSLLLDLDVFYFMCYPPSKTRGGGEIQPTPTLAESYRAILTVSLLVILFFAKNQRVTTSRQ